jgi:predicted patatin/cPLA2 family phospholipase
MANQVLEIIKQRHHTGSQPGKRNDNHKTALLVEGGGMRGVVGGGGLAALEGLNLRPAFDVIYGSSSGAYSASFFAGGDVMTGARFYLDYSQKQFISRRRALSGGPVFDLDYVRTVMHHQTRLNYEGVLHNKPPLHIIATDSRHGRPVILKDFGSAEELDRSLQASANISSYFKPKSLLFKHRRLIDGSILDPFCIRSAVEEKNTHILILFSKPWRNRHMPKIIDTRLISPYLSKVNPHLAEMYLHHDEYSFSGLSHIWNHFDGTHIALISPHAGQKLPSNLTTKRRMLAAGFLAGAEAVLHALDVDRRTSFDIIESFKRELRIG